MNLTLEELYNMYEMYKNNAGISTGIRLNKPATFTVRQPVKMQTTLLIPDCHVTPSCKMDRFKALNALIHKRKPNNIVVLGDFLDLKSLSHWEKNNKLKMEGIRYKEDIDAGNNAIDAIFKDVDMKSINVIWHLGNHSEWSYKYLELNPQLQGHIDIIADLKLRKRGITSIIPYKKYSEIEGVLMTHSPMNAANMPIGGKFAAQKASDLTSKSMVFAHTHSVAQYSCQRHGDDNVIQIYVAGAYFDEIGDYTDGSTMAHNFCISILTHVAPGKFDVEQISKERMLLGAF